MHRTTRLFVFVTVARAEWTCFSPDTKLELSNCACTDAAQARLLLFNCGSSNVFDGGFLELAVTGLVAVRDESPSSVCVDIAVSSSCALLSTRPVFAAYAVSAHPVSTAPLRRARRAARSDEHHPRTDRLVGAPPQRPRTISQAARPRAPARAPGLHWHLCRGL